MVAVRGSGDDAEEHPKVVPCGVGNDGIKDRGARELRAHPAIPPFIPPTRSSLSVAAVPPPESRSGPSINCFTKGLLVKNVS